MSPPPDSRDPSAAPSSWLWRAAAAAVVLWVLLSILLRLQLLVVMVFGALLFTALLKPLADRLQHAGWRPLAATWTVVLGTLVVVGGIVAVLVPRFAAEFTDLRRELTNSLADVRNWLVEGPLGLQPAQIDPLRDRLLRFVGVDGPGAGGAAVAGLNAALLVVSILAGVIVALVLTFFFVKDGERMTEWVAAQFRPNDRARLRDMGRAAWGTLAGYLRGVTLLATFNAVATAIGLLLIGVPLVVGLAVLEFLGSFVPIVGAIGAGAVAALVALATGGVTDALLVVGLAVLIDQIEGHFFQPVVIGHAVKLHPAVVVIVLTAGGLAAGIVGALVAVPLTAAAAAAFGAARGTFPDTGAKSS